MRRIAPYLITHLWALTVNVTILLTAAAAVGLVSAIVSLVVSMHRDLKRSLAGREPSWRSLPRLVGSRFAGECRIDLPFGK